MLMIKGGDAIHVRGTNNCKREKVCQYACVMYVCKAG